MILCKSAWLSGFYIHIFYSEYSFPSLYILLNTLSILHKIILLSEVLGVFCAIYSIC